MYSATSALPLQHGIAQEHITVLETWLKFPLKNYKFHRYDHYLCFLAFLISHKSTLGHTYPHIHIYIHPSYLGN